MTPARRLRASLGFLCLAAVVQSPALAQDQATPPPSPAPETAPIDPALAAAVEAGRGLYLKNCRTCHGTKGSAGVPLAGNPKVSGDPGYLIWAILTGPGYMPEFGPVLSDADIAGISTFIMNSWGNDYGPVTAEDVNGLRQ
jgi:mono/diheme cytochrome c family protein